MNEVKPISERKEGHFGNRRSTPRANNRETKGRTRPGPTTGRRSPPPHDTPMAQTSERSDSVLMMMATSAKLPPLGFFPAN